MSINNGDLPAMPTQVNGGDIFGGLTKREQFAMAAMQGILACGTSEYCKGVHSDHVKNHVANVAVKHADALLAELEKSK